MSQAQSVLRAEQLVGGNWQRVACPGELTDAWRQIHYAAQAASEVGKSWAQPQADDSHTNFGWLADPSQSGFVGVDTATDPAFRTRLDPRRLSLTLSTRDGTSQEELLCDGQTLADVMAWVEKTATQLGGPRRQPAVPAPDLPEHPAASGAPFNKTNAAAFAAVADWYANADALLRILATLLPSADPPRCWPHHMDHATLSIIRQDADGGMMATIGVGITPPDGLDERGYWYVGPWSREPVMPADAWPEPPVGRWIPREGTLPLGVLPLTDIAALDNAVEQECAVADFVAAAVNTCGRNLI
jgi:hypothetical protein